MCKWIHAEASYVIGARPEENYVVVSQSHLPRSTMFAALQRDQ